MLDAVGNGNGVVGVVLRGNDTMVSVLNNSEVVGLAGGHVGLAVHIDHAAEV